METYCAVRVNATTDCGTVQHCCLSHLTEHCTEHCRQKDEIPLNYCCCFLLFSLPQEICPAAELGSRQCRSHLGTSLVVHHCSEQMPLRCDSPAESWFFLSASSLLDSRSCKFPPTKTHELSEESWFDHSYWKKRKGEGILKTHPINVMPVSINFGGRIVLIAT